MTAAAAAPVSWEQQLLQDLKAPVTPLNTGKLDIWAQAEGGLPFNNPFNTGLDVGKYGGQPQAPTIARYPSIGVGVKETAATLQHSPPSYGYQAIVGNLEDQGTQQQFAQDLEASSWDGKHYSGSQLIQQVAGGAVYSNPGTPGLSPGAQAPVAATATAATTPSSSTGVVGSLKEAATRALEVLVGLGLIWLALRQLGASFTGRG